jgi:hypothetical protein
VDLVVVQAAAQAQQHQLKVTATLLRRHQRKVLMVASILQTAIMRDLQAVAEVQAQPVATQYKTQAQAQAGQVHQAVLAAQALLMREVAVVVATQAQAVRVVQVVAETAAATPQLTDRRVQQTLAVVVAVAALTVLAGLVLELQVALALPLCKFKHRCTVVLSLAHLLLQRLLDLQL